MSLLLSYTAIYISPVAMNGKAMAALKEQGTLENHYLAPAY